MKLTKKIAEHIQVARLLDVCKNFYRKHFEFWKNREIVAHVILSVLLLVASIAITFLARNYAGDYTGYIVPDILLDNLPVWDVGFLFFQGAMLFCVILAGFLLWEPLFLPFTLEVSSLFFFVRSFFMVMTHLSPPSTVYYNFIEHEHHQREILFSMNSGSDLFFSGHAGFPFLLALVFWGYRPARYVFLFCSLVGSVIVIVGHLHYTIDVFSAYFIAFGVLAMAKFLFRKEYHLLESAL
jgi:PAP2 superfamily C-terminal